EWLDELAERDVGRPPAALLQERLLGYALDGPGHQGGQRFGRDPVTGLLVGRPGHAVPDPAQRLEALPLEDLLADLANLGRLQRLVDEPVQRARRVEPAPGHDPAVALPETD